MNMKDFYQKKLIHTFKNKIPQDVTIKRLSNNDVPWPREAGWEDKLEFDILAFELNDQTSVYASAGLSGAESYLDKKRYEFMTLYRKDTNFLELTEDVEDQNLYSENLLMYLCCYSVNENDYSKPGEVWINWFSRYTNFNSELEHLFFVESKIFFHDISFEIEGDEVDWLIAIPITDQELAFYEEKGPQALQDLLVGNNIDISNLFRGSLL